MATTENDYIEVPGKLSLTFKADHIDLLQIGVLGTHLHRVLNQVAISIIQVHDQHARQLSEPTAIKFIPQTFNREDALISARIKNLRQGSVEMDIAAVVAAVFTQPGGAAILENLLSNAIWAIGTYAAKMTNVTVDWKSKGRNDGSYDLLLRPEAGRKKLRPRIEKFIDLLAESPNGGRLHLKTSDLDLEIHFNAPPAANPREKHEPGLVN